MPRQFFCSADELMRGNHAAAMPQQFPFVLLMNGYEIIFPQEDIGYEWCPGYGQMP
jgi:hypothetical protein